MDRHPATAQEKPGVARAALPGQVSARAIPATLYISGIEIESWFGSGSRVYVYVYKFAKGGSSSLPLAKYEYSNLGGIKTLNWSRKFEGASESPDRAKSLPNSGATLLLGPVTRNAASFAYARSPLAVRLSPAVHAPDENAESVPLSGAGGTGYAARSQSPQLGMLLCDDDPVERAPSQLPMRISRASPSLRSSPRMARELPPSL
jgi:hypothetical protein